MKVKKYCVLIYLIAMVFNFGCASIINKDIDEAIEKTKKEPVKNKATTVNNEAINFLNQGKPEEALKKFDESIILNPSDPNTWNNKATVLMNLGRYDEALECLDKSIEIDPGNVFTHTARATFLVKIGKFEEALKITKSVVKKQPDFLDAWFFQGIALDGLGRYEEAAESYKRVIQLDPKYFMAYTLKGIDLVLLGKEKEGENCLQEVQKKYQAVDNFLFEQGEFYEKLKMKQKSEIYYRYSLKIAKQRMNLELVKKLEEKGYGKDKDGKD